MLQARHGDAFILQTHSRGQASTIVVDGGPAGTYDSVLSPALDAKVGGSSIDLIVASHIDDDHIHGVLDLVDNARHRVNAAWHNSFDDLVGDASASRSAIVRQMAGILEEPLLRLEDKEADLSVVASIQQGRQLRDALTRAGLAGNYPIGGLVTSGPSIPVGLFNVEVLSPRPEDLERLRRQWRRNVSQELSTEKAARFAAAALDQSVTNLASMVFIVGDGVSSVLMTGDARGDRIVDALEAAGYLRSGPMRVGAMKVPHHGSDRSCTRSLFDAVHADSYFISGDGSHGNPSLDTCYRLLSSRAGAACLVYFSNHVRGVTDEIQLYAQMNTRHSIRVAEMPITSARIGQS